MTAKSSLYVLLGCVLASAAPRAAGSAGGPPCTGCATIEVSAAAVRLLLHAGAALDGVTLLLRLEETLDDDALAAACAALEARGAILGLSVPAAGRLHDGGACAPSFVVVRETATADLERGRMLLQQRITAARARWPGARIGVDASAQNVPALHVDVAPYVEFAIAAVEQAEAVQQFPLWRRAAPRLTPLAAFVTHDGPLVVPVEDAHAAGAVAQARRIAAMASGALVPAEVAADCDPAGAAAACRARVLRDPASNDLVVVGSADRPLHGLRLVPPPPVTASATVLHEGGESVLSAEGGGRLALHGISGPFLVHLPATAPPVTEAVAVTAPRLLSAAEVVARHQAALARQRLQIATVRSTGTSSVTFEVPGFAAPFLVSARTEVFRRDDVVDFVQRDLRLNGVDVGHGEAAPKLPLIESERIAVAPLTIALTRAYRYRLDGVATVSGHDCYVLAFEPAVAGVSLFRGRAWIDRRTFGLVRLHGVQTRLRGAITASAQTDTFVPLRLRHGRDDVVVWLLAESVLRQSYQGAGVQTPIVRRLALDSHAVNELDFAARLAAAHASPAIILRDTGRDTTYLAPQADATGLRRPAGPATRTAAVLAGVIVDPQITRPLPIAGLSFTDVNLFGRGWQMNAVFGGSYGQAALTVPSIARTGWRLDVQAFATAVHFHDRAFAGGVEQYGENLLQRPWYASASAGRGLGRVHVSAAYRFSYTDLTVAESTAPDFVLPDDPAVHALTLRAEWRQAAWQMAGWWTGARRERWGAWGAGGQYPADGRAYQQFGIGASAVVAQTSRTVARVDVSAAGGRGLDRFSRYGIGAFTDRLRGYPAASLRYDYGAIGRSAVSRLVRRGVRLDGFVDGAWLRVPGFDERPRGFAGIGAGIQVPIGWRVLLAAEWGYGIHARRRSGGTGMHTLQITCLRPL